jgi:glycosyltransferase involved in cell wall biosynthesis
MPIKTVHITNYYHKNSGGISTAYNSLLAAAERHRRYMRLIVPGEREEVEELSEFTKIYYIRAPQSPLFDKRYRVIMPWQYIPTNSVIRHILLDEMPQMVEIRDKYTLSAFGTVVRINMFRRLKRPMLVNFSSERMDDNVASFISAGRLPRWFARRYMGNYLFPSYDFHITNSIYTAEEFDLSTRKKNNPGRQEWFTNLCWRAMRSARVPLEDRIRICPSGVDADLFSPGRKSAKVRREMIEKAGIPENAVIILYAGRISPEKNIGLLPEFMKILARETETDYRLLVAGAGPKAEWLQNETDRSIPNKIIQLGHLDKETLADFYANADVFVHPNPKEPFGIAPLEAMASGVPTVAPNSGGLLFYATEENTWLVEPTPENFAAAVKEIIENPELRARKIERALETAQNNTRVKAADNLLETYDKLYEDFQKRNALYTDREAAKTYNFATLLE